VSCLLSSDWERAEIPRTSSSVPVAAPDLLQLRVGGGCLGVKEMGGSLSMHTIPPYRTRLTLYSRFISNANSQHSNFIYMAKSLFVFLQFAYTKLSSVFLGWTNFVGRLRWANVYCRYESCADRMGSSSSPA
jgi:hypothetical protein